MTTRHRAPGSDLRTVITSRLGAGVLVLAALAIGGLVTMVTPDTETKARPFTRSGAVGDQVDGRLFEATVLSVRGAARMAEEEFLGEAKEHDTDGVWVIVKVRVVATRKTTSLGYAALRDAADRTYLATERVDQPLIGGRDLQPGVPVEADIVFEVPRNVATDVDLLLAVPAIDQRLEAQVEVHLPIDGALVDQWLRLPAPGTVAEPRVAP